VSVHFGCNPRPTDCFLTELSRTWPPPVLPDGLVVGDKVHYCGATNQWIHAGRTYRLEHGTEGTVAGASISTPDRKVNIA
jgi:hypothetical protein